MLNLGTKSLLSFMLTSVLCVTIVGTANASAEPAPSPNGESELLAPIVSTPLPVVTSESGIFAIQLAPAGASAEEIDLAIAAYETRAQTKNSALSALTGGVSPMATGAYYYYCEEGASGLMLWTNNDPQNCLGWHYTYLDGRRLAKVNMLRLLAQNSAPFTTPDLNAWCDHNSFYCGIATGIAGAVIWSILGLLDG